MKVVKNVGNVYLWETEDGYEVEKQGPGAYHTEPMSLEEAEAEFATELQF